MKTVWLFQVVSPGIKLDGLARIFGATSAMILPPSHVDHPHRLVMAITSAMPEDELKEELEWGDSGKYVVGHCREEWSTEYPLNDPEFVPLQLEDKLLKWALDRSPTGAHGYDYQQQKAFAAEHPGKYFYLHSSLLPKWPNGEKVAQKVRELDAITVHAREFPWDDRLPEAELPEEEEAQIIRAQQAAVRVPVSAPLSIYWRILQPFYT